MSPACTPWSPAATVVVRTATSPSRRARWSTLDGVELAVPAATPDAGQRLADVHRRRASPPDAAAGAGHDGRPLPVLLDPYGGPHGAGRERAQRST